MLLGPWRRGAVVIASASGTEDPGSSSGGVAQWTSPQEQKTWVRALAAWRSGHHIHLRNRRPRFEPWRRGTVDIASGTENLGSSPGGVAQWTSHPSQEQKTQVRALAEWRSGHRIRLRNRKPGFVSRQGMMFKGKKWQCCCE
jgi:hypothetical protein